MIGKKTTQAIPLVFGTKRVQQSLVWEGSFKSQEQQSANLDRDPFEGGLKPVVDCSSPLLFLDQMTCPMCHKTINRDKHSEPFVCECGWRSQ